MKLFELTYKEKRYIESIFKHYIFFEREKETVNLHYWYDEYVSFSACCTACNEEIYEEQISCLTTHNADGICPICNAKVTYKAKRYGTKNLAEKHNFCVFHAVNEDVLQVQCYTVKSEIKFYAQMYTYTLKQVYTFTEKEIIRYDGNGKQMKNLSEPVFQKGGFYADNSYMLISADEIKKTFMKYSANLYDGAKFFTYLFFYIKHKNIEYLIKAGFNNIALSYLNGSDIIDRSQSSLKKMLCLNSQAYKYFLGLNPTATQIKTFRQIDLTFIHMSTAEKIKLYEMTESHTITEQEAEQFKHLRTADKVCHAVKQRQSILISEARKALNFEYGEFEIIIPATYDEIKAEGKALHHCVESYANRHLNGVLHIVFIRNKNNLAKSFYTAEIDNCGYIVQVRGQGNAEPTAEVKTFIEEYKKYLSVKFNHKEEKTA